jgi:hypothetical protein
MMVKGMFDNNPKPLLGVFALAAVLFCMVVCADAPAVTLVSPIDFQNFTDTSNVTLNCSVTDDSGVDNLTLYHNLSGSFEANETRDWAGELVVEDGLVLLMHFNNDSSVGENTTLVYDWSGNANSGNVIGVNYNDTGGKFGGGFEFESVFDLSSSKNGSIEVQDSSSLDLAENGTIEFWAKPNLPMNSQTYTEWSVLTKGDSGDTSNAYAVNFYTTPEGGSECEILTYLGSGNNYQTLKSEGTLDCSGEEWYHIAVTWDIEFFRIYIDGVENNYHITTATPFDSSGMLRIGRNTALQYTYNGSLDDLAIYNRALTAEEISIHSGQKPTSTSYSWNFYDILDGLYTWNCIAYDNDSNSNWSDSNFSFNVAANPPLFESIVNDPNTEQDIDPGSTITVTGNISDGNGIDTVILQWMEIGDWTNTTMQNLSVDNTNGSYNGSFQIDVTGGTYYYRIFANDTFGNANVSDTYTVVGQYDYTWDKNPDSFGTVTGVVGTNTTVGVIVINNTGDDSIVFDLSSDWANTFYNETEPLTVSANSLESVEVTATVSSEIREDPISITISASHPNQTVSPSSAIANATLGAYTGGAYLDVTVDTYSAAVSQGDSNVTLSATIKNVGNDTALDVEFDWDLPEGWTPSPGNETNFTIGNMSASSTNYSTIYVDLSYLASAGTSTIKAVANATNNASDSYAVSVTVVCKSGDGHCGVDCSLVTDTDCTSPSSGGGGGGGGGLGVPSRVGDVVNSTQKVEVVRGMNESFRISVTNTYPDAVLRNVRISIKGFLSQYLSISPGTIDEIKYGGTKEFNVNIAVPSYMEYGDYPLLSTITGTIVAPGLIERQLRDERVIKLTVYEINKDEGSLILGQAIADLDEMKNAGLPYSQISILLEQAEDALASGRSSVKEFVEGIRKIKDDAFAADKQIRVVKAEIESARYRGLDVKETERLVNLAIAAFEREDFTTALQRVKDAHFSFLLETKGRSNLLRFVYNYWWAIIIVLISASAVSLFVYKRVMIFMIALMLKRSAKEEVTILGLIKDIQKKAFEDKSIPMNTYHKNMLDYENRLANIRKFRVKLRNKRVGLVYIKDGIRGVDKESDGLIEMIKELQHNYFEKRLITKRSYDDQFKVYKESLVELEEEKALLENRLRRDKSYLIYSLPRNVFSAVFKLFGPAKNKPSKGSAKKPRVISKSSGSNSGGNNNSQFLNLDKKSVLMILLAVFIFSFVAFEVKNALLPPTGYATFENATKEAAFDALLKAEDDVKDMGDNNFTLTYVNDTLIAAKKAFSGENYSELLDKIGMINDTARREKARELLVAAQKALTTDEEIKVDYEEVLKLTSIISGRKAGAFFISDSLRSLEFKVQDYKSSGVNTSKGELLIDGAYVAFREDRYADAQDLIDDADIALDSSKAELSMVNVAKNASIGFFQRNWVLILTVFAVLLIAFLLTFRGFERMAAKRRLDGLREQKSTILNLIKEAQIERFEKGGISGFVYGLKMDKYRDKLAAINMEAKVLECKLSKDVKRSGMPKPTK